MNCWKRRRSLRCGHTCRMNALVCSAHMHCRSKSLQGRSNAATKRVRGTLMSSEAGHSLAMIDRMKRCLRQVDAAGRATETRVSVSGPKHRRGHPTPSSSVELLLHEGQPATTEPKLSPWLARVANKDAPPRSLWGERVNNKRSEGVSGKPLAQLARRLATMLLFGAQGRHITRIASATITDALIQSNSQRHATDLPRC